MTLLYFPDTTVIGSHSLSTNCKGNHVVVGAPKSRTGDNTGVAYILDAISGQVLKKLEPPCLQRGDEFGSSVAMNCFGTRALVGAKTNRDIDSTVRSPGVVYLFDIIDSSNQVDASSPVVSLLQTFHNPNPQDYDEFGIVVDMDRSGEIIVIASPNHNHNQGVVYLFNKNGTLIRSIGPPSLLATTFNTTDQPGRFNNYTEHNLHRDQFFGSSLALSQNGKLLLVGAPGKGWTKQLPGAVYLFDATTGDLLKTIHNPSHQEPRKCRLLLCAFGRHEQ